MKRFALLLVSGMLAAAFGMSPAPGAQRWDGVAVLMYHRVDPVVPADAVGRSLTLDPATFAASLAWLRDHHIRSLTTAQLVAALKRGEHPHDAVVLSFDDGYEDAATVVTPLLVKYGAHASFYVSADLIGTPRHASWRELRAMRDAGMEIGCHGSRHLDLTTLSRGEATYEIGHCATALTRYLGAPRTYAYAAGQYNAQAMELLERFGFVAALTEHPGAVTSLAKPLELPRRRVDRDDSLASFASLVSLR
jgi:peptidoglycan/xylan/chitin deacetylase (PgdA/CDA1 family)